MIGFSTLSLLALVAASPAERAAAVPRPIEELVAVEGFAEAIEGGLPEAARAELLPLPPDAAWGHDLLGGRSRPEPVATAAVGSGGRFRLDAPGPGMWAVVVRAPGFVPLRFSPLPLTESVELPPVALRPDAGARVAVETAAGELAAGTWVLARTADPSLRAAWAWDGWREDIRLERSDEDGLVSLPRFGGEELALWAFAAGGTAGLEGTAGLRGARLTLPARPPLRTLEVRDAEGAPAAGVLVSLAAHGWPLGATDEDGRLRLAVEPSRPLTLRLETADGRRSTVELPIEVPAVAPAAVVSLALPPPRPLRGQVLDADRRPLAGALVWLAPDPGGFAITDSAGAYSLPAGNRERVRVHAQARGYLPGAVRLGRAHTGAGRIPALALERAVAVGGRVVDPEGAPLPGAALTARAAPWRDPQGAKGPEPPASRAASGADGRFLLRGLAADQRYALEVTRPAATPAQRFFSRPTGAEPVEDLVIVLRTQRAGFGRVVDSGDAPLEGVQVTVFEPRAWPLARAVETAVTDARGRFELEALPGDTVDLEAQRTGFAPLRITGVPVEAGEAAADLGTLVLTPGAALEGRVVDGRGNALEGAGIWAEETEQRPGPDVAERLRREPPATTAGADGSFRLEDLEPGRAVHLLASSAGYLPAWLLGVEAPAEEPVQIALEPASRLGGRVVDEEGEGISGAWVGVRQARTPGTVGGRRPGGSRSTASDAEGSYLLEELVPGPLVVRAQAEGFLASGDLALELSPGGGVDDARIVLRRGAEIAGRVTGPAGEPVSLASVRAGSAASHTDARGHYRLSGVALGLQALWVSQPDYRRQAREVRVEPGLNEVDVVLEAGIPVAGRAVDEDGRPLTGASIELSGLHPRHQSSYGSKSDPAGSFRVAVDRPDRYALTATLEGYAPGRIPELVVGEEPVEGVEVVLPRGGALAGRVLGVSPEELARVRVEAWRDGGQRQVGPVDYEGRYRIRDLEAGDWWLLATLGEGRREARARVALPAGGVVTRDLELGRGLTLSGRVRFEGEVVAGAHVTLNGLGLPVSRAATTDYRGGFTIEDLEPGRYRLDVLDPGRALSHVEDLELGADRELALEIRAARLTGTVVSGSDGEPLEEALVSLQRLLGGEPGPLTVLATDRRGSFTIPLVTAGLYRLAARKDGYSPTERQLEVDAGAPPGPVELALEPAGGLTLRLRLATGEVPGPTTVSCFDAAGSPVLTDTRAPTDRGFAHFPLVPAGTWNLLVSAEGAAAVWARAAAPGPVVEVTLPPGAALTVRVPELIESGGAGTLSVAGGEGTPFFGVEPGGALRAEWLLAGGTVSVADLPAGAWSLRVVSPDGRVWAGTAATDGRTPAVATLE